MNHSKIKYLNELQSLATDFRIEEETYLLFRISEVGKVLSNLASLDINSEPFENDGVRIDIFNQEIQIFFNENHFLESATIETFEKELGIITFRNNYLYYDPQSSDTLINGELTDSIFIKNTKYYLLILEFFKIKEKEGSNFIDYYNSTNRELVFTSPSKKGTLKIGYTNKIPVFSENLSVEHVFNKFTAAFNSKEFPGFIKNELFEFSNAVEKELRLKNFIEKFNLIYETAERNYDVFLLGFNFDDLKKEFNEKKVAYIESIRTILNKITAQVIALPLSLTAASFAAYKVVDSPFVLWLVFVSFLLSTFYFFYLINFYDSDLDEIRNDFEVEFQEIETNPFFIKHKEELQQFRGAKTQVSKRFELVKNTFEIFERIVALLNGLFIIFILHLLKFHITFGIICAVFFLSFSGYFIKRIFSNARRNRLPHNDSEK